MAFGIGIASGIARLSRIKAEHGKILVRVHIYDGFVLVHRIALYLADIGDNGKRTVQGD